MPWTTRSSGQALSGKGQQAGNGNALDHPAIRAGPQWQEAASRPWKWLGRPGHQGRPSVVKGSKQAMEMPWTTRPSGQALSGKRQQAGNGNALDH